MFLLCFNQEEKSVFNIVIISSSLPTHNPSYLIYIECTDAVGSGFVFHRYERDILSYSEVIFVLLYPMTLRKKANLIELPLIKFVCLLNHRKNTGEIHSILFSSEITQTINVLKI